MSQTPWSSPDEQPATEPPAPVQQPVQPAPAPGWGAQPPTQPGWGQQPYQQPYQQQPYQQQPYQHWGSPPPGQWSAGGPGIVPLRPLSLSDIYDGAIRAVRFNPRTMVGFSALVIAIVTLIVTVPQAALAPLLEDNAVFAAGSAREVTAGDVAELISGITFSVLLPGLSYLVASTVITAFLIIAVDAAVRGEKLAAGHLWRTCRGRLPAVLGLACVNLAFAVLAGLLLLAPGVLLLIFLDSPVPGVVLIVLGVLLAIPVLISVLVGWWALAAPALLLEKLSVIGALRRSAGLVRRSFWRVVGIGLLTAVLTSIISGVIGLPLSLLGLGVSALMDGSGVFLQSLAGTAATNVGSVIAGAVVYPFSAAVSALLYLDLRMRREGLDVQLMSGR